jgi:glycerol dehydrogenase-like iron-containing ADH family enzyme
VEDTPLQHIEEHSFLGVNRTLQEIHIVRSELEEFPTLALQVCTKRYTVHDIVTFKYNIFETVFFFLLG